MISKDWRVKQGSRQSMMMIVDLIYLIQGPCIQRRGEGGGDSRFSTWFCVFYDNTQWKIMICHMGLQQSEIQELKLLQ